MRHLTKRETEIADLIADGCSNREIALRLNISEQTVKNHLQRIFHTLQVETRTKLAIHLLSALKRNAERF